MSERVFSLYVHIPYCLAKCPYCDFNSHAAERWPEREYVDALRREIDRHAGLDPWRDGRLRTVFFGGGTPSLFAAESIGAILRDAFAAWPAANDPADALEVTLEANPGTVDETKLRGFRRVGVNRVSFGVQSFAAHHLRTLGRIHDGPAAVDALRGARAAGFENVSLDLIFALPEQRPAEWAADLEQAFALRPDHVSAYNLTYEEGTPFRLWRDSGRLRQQPEETELEMFHRARTFLAAGGYAQYEISNYARPGYACRHNLGYWHSRPYLGIGAGAHSYSSGGDGSDWGRRWSNRKNPSLYIDEVGRRGSAVDHSEILDEAQARGEFVFLALRCLDGFAADEFRARFDCDFDAAFPHVAGLRKDDLLELDAGRWRLTERGLRLGDSVFATFV